MVIIKFVKFCLKKAVNLNFKLRQMLIVWRENLEESAEENAAH